MTRSGRWLIVLVVVGVLAVVGWVARYGPPDWLLADEHPVRNVLEGLSWPASVLALVAAVLALRPRAPGRAAGDQGGPGAGVGTSLCAGDVSGVNIQVGRDARGVVVGERPAAPRRRGESGRGGVR